MRVVLDTNVVVSDLLWKNTPRQVLDATREERLTAWTSAALLAELSEVLGRDHLAGLIARLDTTAADLVHGYSKLARLVAVSSVPRVVQADPDDDHVLACALAARAELIVTGDHKHLLPMTAYKGISIVTSREAIARITR